MYPFFMRRVEIAGQIVVPASRASTPSSTFMPCVTPKNGRSRAPDTRSSIGCGKATHTGHASSQPAPRRHAACGLLWATGIKGNIAVAPHASSPGNRQAPAARHAAAADGCDTTPNDTGWPSISRTDQASRRRIGAGNGFMPTRQPDCRGPYTTSRSPLTGHDSDISGRNCHRQSRGGVRRLCRSKSSGPEEIPVDEA